MTTTTLARPNERAEAKTAAMIAVLFGLGLVFAMGFAHSATLHNAAHDTRHVLSFPCH